MGNHSLSGQVIVEVRQALVMVQAQEERPLPNTEGEEH